MSQKRGLAAELYNKKYCNNILLFFQDNGLEAPALDQTVENYPNVYQYIVVAGIKRVD